MCRVLKVSESGYYHSLSHACEPRPWQLLLVKIKQVYARFRITTTTESIAFASRWSKAVSP